MRRLDQCHKNSSSYVRTLEGVNFKVKSNREFFDTTIDNFRIIFVNINIRI